MSVKIDRTVFSKSARGAAYFAEGRQLYVLERNGSLDRTIDPDDIEATETLIEGFSDEALTISLGTGPFNSDSDGHFNVFVALDNYDLYAPADPNPLTRWQPAGGAVPAEVATLSAAVAVLDTRTDSLESSSATAASRIAVMREAALNLKDPQFGAIGDGSSPTADTAALAAAKAAIANTGNYRGGKILVPPGDYRITTGLNGDDSQGLIIEGVAGRATNQPRLLYTPSTGSLITGKSSQGLTLRNLRLEYSHASYAGEFLNFDHSALATDVFFLTIEDCWIGGVSGVSGARSLLRLNKTIISKIRGNRFMRAQVGVRGRDPDYSVAIDIEAQNEFNELSVAGVYCPGESWTIDSNTFEPVGGAASGISTDLAAFAQGLNITGNWFGDVTSGSGTWIKAHSLGGSISGNRMGTPGPSAGSTHMALHACEGLVIAGNRMEDGTNGIDFATSPCIGLAIVGNNFSDGITNKLANLGNLQSSAILGNRGYTANQIGGPLTLGGYLTLLEPVSAGSVPNFSIFRDAADNVLKQKDNSGVVSAI